MARKGTRRSKWISGMKKAKSKAVKKYSKALNDFLKGLKK